MSATLASLRIRDLALVEDILWEPAPGFTAVTGETGAGKSIILGALKLLLGERGDKSLIRTGTASCTIEAAFANADDSRIALLLEEQGAEPCEDGLLLIKRVLSADSGGRQFVNGSACTLALLRALGDLLVDLHGPHDHQSLFSREQQTRLLDDFAGARPLREEYASARRHFLHLEEEQAAILAEEHSAAREVELLDHQTAEIEEAELSAGEEENLLARQSAAANARRIGELCAGLSDGVSESDGSASAKLGELSRLARELIRLDPRAEKIGSACEEAFTALGEFAAAVQSYAAGLEDQAGRLPEITARLDLIQSLKRKYGATIADVLEFGGNAAARLAQLRARGERRSSLDAEISKARDRLLALGKKLSAARKTSSTRLAAAVASQLRDLGFAKAEFTIALEPLPQPGAHGMELAEFLFCPNPGEPPAPLRAIASSGEISRVMLALKAALAAQDDVPVLVFDEIDANVGGEIAARVGEKMRQLGQARQVLCITHLPQVAAAAAAQSVVTKEVSQGRTATHISPLSDSEREEEIARMLGGRSGSALAHARTLLGTSAAKGKP